MSKILTVVVSEDRSPVPAQEKLQQRLLGHLGPIRDVNVALLPHLYDLAGDGSGMDYLRSVDGDLVVLAWLYPRAIYWILDANGVKGRMGPTAFFPQEELPAAPTSSPSAETAGERTIWCIDLRGHETPGPLIAELDRIVEEVRGVPVAAGADVVSAEAEAAPAAADAVTDGAGGPLRVAERVSPRWYPVVDRTRCGGCLECLNFCLFGVFGEGADAVLLVEQADACRDGCPACARVCPSGAIMFPMHQNTAIAGDHRAPREAFQMDLVQLLGSLGPKNLAAAERERIVGSQRDKPSGKRGASRKPSPGGRGKNDKLDELVDGLDEAEL